MDCRCIYDPQVSVSEWQENLPGEGLPILVKEYQTPAGTLRAEVRQTRDWPWGDHVPLFDDYIEPRSRKFLVEDSPRSGCAPLPARSAQRR